MHRIVISLQIGHLVKIAQLRVMLIPIWNSLYNIYQYVNQRGKRLAINYLEY
jgi:hypothetical protein